MTDIRSYININPLDLETNRAIGVSLPFNGEGVFNSTYTSKDQIKTNILSVILTEQGERIFSFQYIMDILILNILAHVQCTS